MMFVDVMLNNQSWIPFVSMRSFAAMMIDDHLYRQRLIYSALLKKGQLQLQWKMNGDYGHDLMISSR